MIIDTKYDHVNSGCYAVVNFEVIFAVEIFVSKRGWTIRQYLKICSADKLSCENCGQIYSGACSPLLSSFALWDSQHPDPQIPISESRFIAVDQNSKSLPGSTFNERHSRRTPDFINLTEARKITGGRGATRQRIIVAIAASDHLTFGQGVAPKISVGRSFTKDCPLTCLTMARFALGAIAADQIIVAVNEIRIVHWVHRVRAAEWYWEASRRMAGSTFHYFPGMSLYPGSSHVVIGNIGPTLRLNGPLCMSASVANLARYAGMSFAQPIQHSCAIGGSLFCEPFVGWHDRPHRRVIWAIRLE
jgi:hypothetical protein